MAKPVLPTNYMDDVLSYNMNGKRRYRETNNYDGTISLEDATTYDRVGSNFGARELNDMCEAINESADKNRIIDNLSDIDANRQPEMIAGALALSELSKKLKVEHFLTKNNYTTYLSMGDLRGGRIENISGDKFGNIVTLYVQINDITSVGNDKEIFRFKEAYKRKYGPSNYSVHNAHISKQDNIVYIGQFKDSHFTMSIAGNGVISPSQKAQVLFTITYITEE